jgi:predicted acylesterase/phospholipase RssA
MSAERSPSRRSRRKVAFVLGGGGHMRAHEVGVIRALLERDVKPDLVVGRPWAR